MNKLFSGKRLLIVCLVLSLVLLCAGAFVFGFLGFMLLLFLILT